MTSRRLSRCSDHTSSSTDGIDARFVGSATAPSTPSTTSPCTTVRDGSRLRLEERIEAAAAGVEEATDVAQALHAGARCDAARLGGGIAETDQPRGVGGRRRSRRGRIASTSGDAKPDADAIGFTPVRVCGAAIDWPATRNGQNFMTPPTTRAGRVSGPDSPAMRRSRPRRHRRDRALNSRPRCVRFSNTSARGSSADSRWLLIGPAHTLARVLEVAGTRSATAGTASAPRRAGPSCSLLTPFK